MRVLEAAGFLWNDSRIENPVKKIVVRRSSCCNPSVTGGNLLRIEPDRNARPFPGLRARTLRWNHVPVSVRMPGIKLEIFSAGKYDVAMKVESPFQGERTL